MPASLRAPLSRGRASSRPYSDRRSPAKSPAQSESPLTHPHLLRSLPPASPIQDPYPDRERGTDIPPDRPGLPTYADYKRIEVGYLQSLSPRKRDKALITQAMFDKIWDVLHQPEACTIETPQFRFWVRKMFSLSRPMPMYVGDGGWGGTGVGMYPDTTSDSDADYAEEADLELERAMMSRIDDDANTSAELLSAVVLHENRPVAIVEQLYDLFCYCHVRARHGGRDKTCAVIRQHYSWVPKELTAQFVKACPTCALKRGGHGHGHGGLGMGVLGHQRRVVGQRERRIHETRVVVEEMPVPVSAVPSSLGNMGWPTTGGPLDPANPEPCGVREREQAWLRVHETIEPSRLPISPTRASVDASGSRTRCAPSDVPLENGLPGPGGWNGALTTDAVSPLHLCDATNRSTGFSQPFVVHRTWVREKKYSPTRTGPPAGLPSLASALSNESLDENVNLTELAPETADECLPPVLRPLRLSGPVPSDTGESAADLLPFHEFQIDPVLLSFDYPGLGLSESGSGGGAMPLGVLSSTVNGVLLSSETLAGQGPGWPARDSTYHVAQVQVQGTDAGLCRLPHHRPSDSCYVDVESLHTHACTVFPDDTLDPTMTSSSSDGGGNTNAERHGSNDALDSGFTAHDRGVIRATVARSRSSRTRRRSGSHRDSPLGTLYHHHSCSADEVGQEHLMTDA